MTPAASPVPGDAAARPGADDAGGAGPGTPEPEGAPMSDEQLEELGPIDYVVLEWEQGGISGEAAQMILDLVDRGTIRILDVAFLAKEEDGSITALELSDLGEASPHFAAFDGASSGLLDEQDLREAGAALRPGASAVLLVWENRWAAPLAVALRRSGGQLVASGRIPVQAILASLDASEAATA
jgi:hypothetical protein